MPRPDPVRPLFDDLDAVRALHRPGKVVPFDELYAEYVSHVEADERAPAARNGFARALTASGWTRRVVRRTQGRRGRQRVLQRTVCRVIPGGVEGHPEDDRTCAVLRSLLGDSWDQVFSEVALQEAYAIAARREGWKRPVMNNRQLVRWLNERNIPPVLYGGQKGRGGRPGVPGRLVDRVTLDRIAPDPSAVLPSAPRPEPDPFMSAEELLPLPTNPTEDLFASVDEL